MKKRNLAISLVLLLLMLTGGVAAAQSSQALWFIEYWNNPDQQGNPAHTASAGVVDYNWGNGSPHASIEANTWSGRWTTKVDFSAGTYRFTTISDDGVRLYVGDKHIILDWKKGPVRTNASTVSLSGGSYPVALDYFEDQGHAELEMYWERLGPPAATGGYVTILSSGQAGNPPSGNWSAEYWNNRTLQGSPAVTRTEAEINYNWGNGSPATGIGNDNWSARWTSNIHFPAGTYRFVATMDDGMRVWVDGVLIVDAWYDSTAHTIMVERYLSTGTHYIRVEYYEHGGGAVARLSWQLVSAPPAPPPPAITNWRGEYFNNMSLSGNPALVRDDANVSFNWGFGSPAAGIHNDNFSARWTRDMVLTPGRYRFTVITDDGARLWVNNQMLVDQWYPRAVRSFSGEIDLFGGPVPIRMEYFEQTGLAEAHLSWTRIGGSGTGTGGIDPDAGTATITAGGLNVRSGPGTGYHIITVVTRNTVLPLLGYRSADNRWVMVGLSGGRQGWVHTSYIQTSVPVSSLTVWTGQGPGTTPPPAGAAQGTVTAYFLNVRSGPSTAYHILTVAENGMLLTLTHRNSAASWLRVILPNGTQGWVYAGYVRTTTPINSLPIWNG